MNDLDEFLELVYGEEGERYWVCRRKDWAGLSHTSPCPFVLTNVDEMKASKDNLPRGSTVRTSCSTCQRRFTLCDCGNGLSVGKNNEIQVCVWFRIQDGQIRCRKIED